MLLTRAEWGMIVAGGVLVAWASWSWTTVNERADRDLMQMRRQASGRWTAWVETGIPADSATQLALTDLRTRIAGDTPTEFRLPFIAEPNPEGLRQAYLLNPFHAASTTAPRTTREAQSLHEARADIRNAVTAGRPTVRDRRASQAHRALGAAIALSGALALFVVRRAQRRQVSAPVATFPPARPGNATA